MIFSLLEKNPMSRALMAFTLVELLVVIGIVAILAGLISPVISSMRERGDAAACASNLKQIGAGLFLFSSDHEGCFPLTGNVVDYGMVDSATGLPSWMEQLEPYLGGGESKIFRCPSAARKVRGTEKYSYFLGVHAAAKDGDGTSPLSLQKIQNPSKYILAGDVIYTAVAGDADKDNTQQNLAFRDSGDSPIHNSSVNILFADGSVRACKEFDPDTMAITYDGPGVEFER